MFCWLVGLRWVCLWVWEWGLFFRCGALGFDLCFTSVCCFGWVSFGVLLFLVYGVLCVGFWGGMVVWVV